MDPMDKIQMGPSCETHVGPKLETMWFSGGCRMGLLGGSLHLEQKIMQFCCYDVGIFTAQISFYAYT